MDKIRHMLASFWTLRDTDVDSVSSSARPVGGGKRPSEKNAKKKKQQHNKHGGAGKHVSNVSV